MISILRISFLVFFIISCSPDFGKYYYKEGVEKIKNDKYEEAIDDFSKSLNYDKNYATYHNMGYCYFLLNKDSTAIKYYNKSIKMKDDEPVLYNNRGYSFYKLGDYEKAKPDFYKAIKLDSTKTKAYLNLLNSYIEQENLDSAFIIAKQALNYDKSKYTFINLSFIYFKKSRYKDALKYGHRAIKKDSSYAYAYHLMGKINDSLYNYRNSIKHYSKAIELSPDSGHYYHSRGTTYFKLNNNKKGCSDIKKAKEKDFELPNDYSKCF